MMVCMRRPDDEAGHDVVDVFQFSLCPPSLVLPAPTLSGLEPYCERFSKVLRGMRLGVPCIEVEHIVPTSRLGLVPFRIRHPVGAEGILPAPPRMKPVRVVDRMSSLVTQNAQALAFASPFNFKHLSTFQFHQPRMSEVKRYGKPAHAVGCKPFFRQPDMRPEFQRPRLELTIELLNPLF